jgi:hypothetical protein
MSDKSALERSWDENRKLRGKVDLLTDASGALLQHIAAQDEEIARMKEERLTIYDAGYERGGHDAVEGHYAPPREYPEEFPDILAELFPAQEPQ